MNEGQQIAEATWFAVGSLVVIGVLFFTPAGPWLWAFFGRVVAALFGPRQVEAYPEFEDEYDDEYDDEYAPPADVPVMSRSADLVRAPVEDEPAPAAPCTDGAAGADAVQAGAVGARTAPAPPEGGALTPQIVAAMRQIAAHKMQQPADGKVATAKALGIGKSGTSERYAIYSAAWDLLYPAPVAVAPDDDSKYAHPLTDEQAEFREQTGLKDAAARRQLRTAAR